jgi:Putative DNA-binding domain
MTRTIPTEESLQIEFKSDRAKLSDRDIAVTVVCLADTEDGDLYLGVEHDGTVTGLHPEHRDEARLAASIVSRSSTSLGDAQGRPVPPHDVGRRGTRARVSEVGARERYARSRGGLSANQLDA